MRILINNEEYNIPSSLSEITLQQRINYQEQYGNNLDEWLKEISVIEDPLEKEIAIVEFNLEKMFQTMAFFIQIEPEVLKTSSFIDDISRIYYSSLEQLINEEQNMVPEYEFSWNNVLWELKDPILKNGDKMTFGEFIDSKQIIQNLVGLGKNRWECLLPLCAIFFRKKGEEYDESFLYENSERLELMKNLPLNYALQVGFFLSSSLNSYTQVSQYSQNQK